MRKVAPLLLLRLALLVAVFACAVLLVEYENMGDPAFCGAGSGCMVVRHSPYSVIAGIHLPLLGLCAQAGLLAFSLVAAERANTFFVAAAAAVGSLVALFLLGIMAFQLGTFCKWCVLVDGCTVVAALAAIWLHLEVLRDPSYEPFLAALVRRRGQLVVWALGAGVVVGLPFLWGEYPVIPPAPAQIGELAVPGKVTIVAFTDFECPFCRKLSPVLEEVRDNWGDRALLVRKMAPLSMHHGAMPAALAYVCAPEEQRDAMAKKLYAAPEPTLTLEGVKGLARQLHLDEDRFARCLEGPEARARVDADRRLFDELGIHGLPYTYVGKRAVAGFSPEPLRKLGREAMEEEHVGLPLWGMVGAALLVVASIGLVTLRFALRESAALGATPVA